MTKIRTIQNVNTFITMIIYKINDLNSIVYYIIFTKHKITSDPLRILVKI